MNYFSEYKGHQTLAYEILSMSLDMKKAVLRELDVTKHVDADNCTSYTFKSCNTNNVITVSKRNNDKWYKVGLGRNTPQFVMLDYPVYYNDSYYI